MNDTLYSSKPRGSRMAFVPAIGLGLISVFALAGCNNSSQPQAAATPAPLAVENEPAKPVAKAAKAAKTADEAVAKQSAAAAESADAAKQAASKQAAAASAAAAASVAATQQPVLQQDGLTLSSLELDAGAVAAFVEGTGRPGIPVYEQNGIKVYHAGHSTAFPYAKLKLAAPADGAVFAGEEVPFAFEVSRFELGAETADAAKKGLANSGMGQHIHLIVDDGAYSAHYEPAFVQKIAKKGHHIGIAFLSRSYHESVKNPSAYQVFQFTTGQKDGVAEEQVDLSKPMLFYSRPKGEYVGPAETGKVLLDFYVVNTALSPTGNQVKVDIDGKDSFNVTRWIPLAIEGLSEGDHTITLTLVDAEGKPVESPQGGGSQTITLKPAPADGSVAAPAAHGHGH